jgi:ATP-binding cassette subfamily B protein
VNNFVFAAVGVTGALIACGGGLTVGQITMFLAYASQYAKPFNEISGIAAQLTAALASADRVFKLIDTPFEDADDPTEPLEAAVPEKIGEVSLENVSFSYSPDKKLIEALNLEAKPGQRIAIVGPTGCGKTTIINLLMRFYDIRGGNIYADGRNAYSIHRRDLRQRYAMVLQDTWLMRGTVAENIAYGAKGEVSRAEIEQAAERAMASPFIRQLKNGYDTVIDDGDSLSGGQKQLICIARVMLAAARNRNGGAEPMLILDEATSNIDTRTELLVQRAFADLMCGRTSFVVAHRLSTIKSSDIILVMDAGKVVEQGSHEQLLAKNGFYAALWKAMTENS